MATVADNVEAYAPGAPIFALPGGGAPLNPNFRYLVEAARGLGRQVIVRCNLTILSVAGMDWLAEFYREHQVELVCSLPCYTADNVDQQRGRGVFDKSIAALQMLNQIGYGRSGPQSRLNPG